jgi:hypothetical protein
VEQLPHTLVRTRWMRDPEKLSVDGSKTDQ